MSGEIYMIYLATLAVFFAAPPDSSELLVMSHSLRHGLRRSFATITGDLSANAVQMSIAAFGLAAVLAAQPALLNVIKWGGVAYLVWLGLDLLRTKGGLGALGYAGEGGWPALYGQGFLTSATNPYPVIFFAALFPQFITPDLPLVPQLLILGVTYILIDLVQLVFWGWLAVKTLGRVGAAGNIWIGRISGLLMIGAATLLALKDITTLSGAT